MIDEPLPMMVHRGLDYLVDRSGIQAIRQGFTDQTVGESLMLMVTELAEAYEDYRRGHTAASSWTENDGKPCGIPSELADTCIRIFHFCYVWKIPLADAILDKLDYNLTRGYRHGGKII
jgi:hypothetical protein